MELKHILGRTYCLIGQTVAVPFYMLDDRRIVLLDSGLDSGRQRDSLIALLEPYEVTAIIAGPCRHQRLLSAAGSQDIYALL